MPQSSMAAPGHRYGDVRIMDCVRFFQLGGASVTLLTVSLTVTLALPVDSKISQTYSCPLSSQRRWCVPQCKNCVWCLTAAPLPQLNVLVLLTG